MNPSDYLKSLPPPSVNNSRKLFKEWIDKAEKAHGDQGDYYVQKLESMGFCGDLRTGTDFGNYYMESNEE